MANNINNNKPGMPQLKRPRFTILWVYAILGIVIVGYSMFSGREHPARIGDREVIGMITAGEVEKIDVVTNTRVAEIRLKEGAVEKYRDTKEYKNIPGEGVQFVYNVPSVEIFYNEIKELKEQTGTDLEVLYGERRNAWMEFLGGILPFVLIIAVWIVIMRMMSRGAGGGAGGGGIFNVGKAKAQMFDKDSQVKTTFKDVAGLEEAKVEVMEIVDFLKKPQKYKDLGGKIPKGALLVGPPGTGKTLLAKAVAGEANVPFFSISGSDFVEMFVGVGASRVRDLFRQAKEKAPCIVFIDEIDAIGRARGKNVGYSSNDERENTLNQLLTEMDGFGTNSGVIILAATNRADILDKALMRAGRFDRQIEVGLPDLNERKEIFDVHLKNLKLVKDLDREFLAKQTPGFSGADIANVCNEAALIAARKNKSAIDKEDFLAAVDRIVGGLEKRNTIMTPQEKRTIAFHEAGHATVSWLLEDAHPLIKVTIIPRGKALGAAWYLPDERQITTREQLMHEIAATMGGRVSEMLTFGRISTGALSDLEKATKMAYAMVVYYGMSENVGNVSYYDSTGQSDMAFTKPFSEETARKIDQEVKSILAEAEAMAMEILQTHKEGLTALAEILLEREVIFTEDVENIFGKRKKDIEKERAEAAARAKTTGQDALAGECAPSQDYPGEGGRGEKIATLESELPQPDPIGEMTGGQDVENDA
ncbi:MAG: ATP-dependent zinc metalloprotease FtsH [Alistipes sp.]|nr:ATP-dependent zinc metalloprotease FtsH [Alistipes sp.]